jgi:aldehyde oxidoreductase
MPGVFKVVTHKDIKGKNRITGLITFPSNKGDGWDRPIFCDDQGLPVRRCHRHRLRRYRKANAKAAAAKVKVDLEAARLHERARAMADDAMEIHPGTPNIYYVQKIAKGDETGPFSTRPMRWWKTIFTSAASPTCPSSRTWALPTRTMTASW